MKITKFIHACILLEAEGNAVLFDPGSFTWDDGNFDLNIISKLDTIVITHKHGDHFNSEFLAALLEKFPEAVIVCNNEVRAAAEESGIAADFKGTDSGEIRSFTAPHESIDAMAPGQTPANTGYHYGDILTHPGDSFSFRETRKVLAMPFTAPWGSVMQGVDLTAKLRPEVVFLIHDWHYGESGREWLFNALKERFVSGPTKFVPLNPGESYEL